MQNFRFSCSCIGLLAAQVSRLVTLLGGLGLPMAYKSLQRLHISLVARLTSFLTVLLNDLHRAGAACLSIRFCKASAKFAQTMAGK